MRRWRVVYLTRVNGKLLRTERFFTRWGAEREAARMAGALFFAPVVERIPDGERKAWRAWR